MTAPVNVHVEEINAALVRLRLEPTDVLVVKVPDAELDLCQIITRAIGEVVEAAGLPNRVMAVPAEWEFEVVGEGAVSAVKGPEVPEADRRRFQEALDQQQKDSA